MLCRTQAIGVERAPDHIHGNRETVAGKSRVFAGAEHIHEHLARSGHTLRGNEQLEELTRLPRCPLRSPAAERDDLKTTEHTNARLVHGSLRKCSKTASFRSNSSFGEQLVCGYASDVVAKCELGELDLSLGVPCQSANTPAQLDRKLKVLTRLL